VCAVLLELFKQLLEADATERSSINERIDALPTNVRHFVVSAQKEMDLTQFESTPVPDDCEDLAEWLMQERFELERLFRSLFEEFFRTEPTALDVLDVDINHSPGLTWSWREFYATDAEACAKGMSKRADEFAAVIKTALTSEVDDDGT
jgi:hypothetical protein